MPGMDGIRLLQRLRHHGTTTPFIMFTGKGCEDVAVDALNSGADFYVRKEGSPEEQFAEIGSRIWCAVSGRRAEEASGKNEELYQWLS